MKRLLLVICCLTTFQAWPQQSSPETAINDLMNAWHRAAATADEDIFFGSMTEDCIYIGTDKTELWRRDELKEWSAKYFDSDKAWDFKPIHRNVYLGAEGKMAWFDETLDTWMGVCRSSGVLVKVPKEGWKLSHYHLSVTIDNDLVDGFLSLIASQPISDSLRQEVISPIQELFEAMKESDGEKLMQVFADSATLNTPMVNKEGKIMLKNDSVEAFAKAIATPHKEVYDERVLNYDVRVDGHMATVWTPYEFYVGDTFSHCGVNAFQLVNTEDGWKILHITDTRRKTGCKDD